MTAAEWSVSGSPANFRGRTMGALNAPAKVSAKRTICYAFHVPKSSSKCGIFEVGATIHQFRLRYSSSATGVPVTFLFSRADREQIAATERRSLSHERSSTFRKAFVCVGDRDGEFLEHSGCSSREITVKAAGGTTHAGSRKETGQCHRKLVEIGGNRRSYVEAAGIRTQLDVAPFIGSFRLPSGHLEISF
ncbi:hypothetical protein K0M31_012022 [Melipona bicolor]|uniref:Uncharacterized protein n=1 Tax=Melipona bicolor TaxID=60889 RepID=A0AA40KVF5_9HYME|nr:hypothetical protein K0M31_012022 [Melipona bicolor]